jgi:small subunit ribosomal protein S1
LRLVKDGVAIGDGVATSGSAPTADVAAPVADAKPKAPRPKRGQIVTGKVHRLEPFGVFIEWEGGSGLIPAAETGTDRGTDMKRHYHMGQEIKAEVIEINGDKVKLSITSAQRSEERADLEAWKAQENKKSGGGKGFGTLADKLKGLSLK